MPLSTDNNSTSLKFCVDCKHYRKRSNTFSSCESPKLDYVDLVTGETEKRFNDCTTLRRSVPDALDDRCGTNANWFEPKGDIDHQLTEVWANPG
jgi:hypothetical protein